MDTQPWKILLVEDDEDDYILTKVLLTESKGSNFRLLWIPTYEAAVQILREQQFDAVLVDYLLDTLNGLDLVREAISMGCTAPVIVLTGQGSYEIDVQAMQSGAVDYLVKGQINADVLERTIRYAIELKKSQEALRQAHGELELRVQERTQELLHTNQELQAEIAERMRVEAQLRIRTTALESAANGIFITDRMGNILWSNPAFSQMTGYATGDVLGKNPRFLRSGRQSNAFFEDLWKTILSGKVWHGEMTNRRKDGNLYIEEQTITPVCDDQGEVAHFIAIKHDISERKHAEETIRRNATRSEILAEISRALVEAGPDFKAVLQLITQKIAMYMGNNCIVSLLSADGVWLTPAAFHHPDPNAYKVLHSLVEAGPQDAYSGLAGEVMKTGSALLWNDGSSNQLPNLQPGMMEYLQRYGLASALIVPLRVHGKLIGTIGLTRDRGGQPYNLEDQVFVQSISDRAALALVNAQLYGDLQAALEEELTMRRQLVLAEKHSAMSRMVASVAHELNNPIQTIQNCLFLINQDIAPDTEIAGFTEMALSETRRVSDLVSQLREIYRPSKAGPMQLLDLFKILDEVRVLLSPHLQHQCVEWSLHSSLNPEQATIIYGISDQIKQVFINLGLNAVEAMQPEGGTLWVNVGPSKKEHQIAISFSDSGPGIATEYLSQIFEPFFTTKESGTGLGLSICYDIVERHAGTIMVENNPDKGATFSVWLPITKKEVCEP